MIRVAFDLRDPVRSGIARVATSTLKAFLGIAPGRFEVLVAGPAGPLADLGVAGWGDVSVVPFNAARYSVAAELEWPRVRDAAPDAIWFFPHFDVPMRAGGERFLAVVHDVMHFDGPAARPLKGGIARMWMRRTIGRSVLTHTPSRFTAQRLTHVWPDLGARIRVVPNGVDETFFAAAGARLPARVLEWTAGRRYMLSVGNLKRHKNLRVGVEILVAFPDLVWVVIGEHFPDWHEVAERARVAGVESRVLVLPREGDDVLAALYRNSAFLLFPSLYEGFGLPVLEAMAAGAPVVATSATSVPEVLGDSGWLCDPTDPAQFVRAAGEVLSLDGSERAARVERARARARTFSWSQCARAVAESMETIARETAIGRSR